MDLFYLMFDVVGNHNPLINPFENAVNSFLIRAICDVFLFSIKGKGGGGNGTQNFGRPEGFTGFTNTADHSCLHFSRSEVTPLHRWMFNIGVFPAALYKQ